jgi:hypothetical protein
MAYGLSETIPLIDNSMTKSTCAFLRKSIKMPYLRTYAKSCNTDVSIVSLSNLSRIPVLRIDLVPTVEV